MTPRDRLTLQVGAGVVVLAVLVLRVVPLAVSSIGRAGARLAERRALLLETNAAMRGLSSMEDSARTLTSRVVALAPRLLAGPTAPSALSDLSGRLTAIAARHHAALVALEALPDSAGAGSLRRLSARAVLETDFRGVAEILAVLGRDAVALRAERIVVTPTDPYAAAAQAEQLRVELRLSGWYLVQAAQS